MKRFREMYTQVYLATAREFLRDKTSVFIILVMPLLFAGFFAMLMGKNGNFLPGTLSIALLWLGIFGTAQPMVTMREQKVLRRFALTPLPPFVLLASQVSWRLTVGVVQCLMLFVFSKLAFGVGITGSFLLLTIALLLGILALVSMGYLIAGVSPSSESALALGQVVNFLMMFLSGSLVPVDLLPKALKPVVNALPLTHLTDALQQLIAGTPAVFSLNTNLLVLGGWLVVMTAISVRFFQWE